MKWRGRPPVVEGLLILLGQALCCEFKMTQEEFQPVGGFVRQKGGRVAYDQQLRPAWLPVALPEAVVQRGPGAAKLVRKLQGRCHFVHESLGSPHAVPVSQRTPSCRFARRPD
jgi:hypothetical protein